VTAEPKLNPTAATRDDSAPGRCGIRSSARRRPTTYAEYVRTSAADRHDTSTRGGSTVSEPIPPRARRAASGNWLVAAPPDPGEKRTTGQGPFPSGCVQ